MGIRNRISVTHKYSRAIHPRDIPRVMVELREQRHGPAGDVLIIRT